MNYYHVGFVTKTDTTYVSVSSPALPVYAILPLLVLTFSIREVSVLWMASYLRELLNN